MSEGKAGKDDRTVFPTTSASVRTSMPEAAPPGNTLPPGHRLHEFRIDSVLGEGGFGIVYLARDLQLERTVALKEYMPASLAARGPDLGISVRSERHRETFELGLRSFVNEARLLASFDHPSLVKVYRFWEANGTAYMVMPFYEGPTLKTMLKQMGAPPDEQWLKQLLRPLLDALDIIHADHCYHRDIAPDNILLLGPQLKPLLLDFGAARRVIGDATQALTVILKPGYAPVEQYAEVPSMKQGAWTDVYALCAVLYASITGRAPTPSVGRLMTDDLMPVSQKAAGRYSAPFLAAIDRGLSVRPEDRPQTIAALREALFASAPADDEATQIQPAVTIDLSTASMAKLAAMPLPAAGAAAPAASASAPSAAPSTRAHTPPAGPSSTAAAPRRGSPPWWLVGAAVALLVAGVAWFVWRGKAPPAPASAAVEVAGTTPAPATGASAAATAPAPQAAPVTAPLAAPAPAARGEFSRLAVLEDIVRHSDPAISVNTLADKETLRIGIDRMQFRVRSSDPGYLYVFFVGTKSTDLSVLFPNRLDADNRITADAEVVLPRKGWNITAGGPPGTNQIVTMVSRVPRDFAAIAPKDGEFDIAAAQQLWATANAADSPFAGTPRCEAGKPCDSAYGATLIRIHEAAAK